MILVYLLVRFVISAALGAFALAGLVVAVLLRYSGRRRLSLFFICIPSCTGTVAILFGWIRIWETGDILGFLIVPPLGAVGGLALALALRSRVGPDSV